MARTSVEAHSDVGPATGASAVSDVGLVSERYPRWRRIRSALSGPGVLFSLIWQVFLVYPVLAVLSADAATVWTVLGLVSVVAFSASYLVAFASPAVTRGFSLDPRDWRPVGRSSTDLPRGELQREAVPRGPLGLGYLAVLVVCAFGTAPAAGAYGAVTFLPFLACFVTGAWPLRSSVPVSLGLIVAGAVTALAVGETALFIPAFFVVPVAISMIGTRVLAGASEREGQLRWALGAAEERERVARDLHDVLGHTLTSLTIRAQLADALVDTDPGGAHRELETIEELTRTALSEMRQTVSGMRIADPEVELAGLSAALRSAGIDVAVSGSHDSVPTRHSALAAWILREAGTNILRHSGAGRVTIEFIHTGLRITDDGVGLEARRGGKGAGADGGAGAKGFVGRVNGQGLAGLEARARDEGAMLVVSDADGIGTIVEVRWS